MVNNLCGSSRDRLSMLICAALFMLGSAGAGALGTWPSAFVAVEQVPADLQTATSRPITVLDARSSKAYRRGHIPGAQHAPWTRYRAGWFRSGRLPEDLDKLARQLAELGVDDKRPVLVCGAAQDGWGEEGRIAWMLRYLGHPEVAILDGGCRAWREANRPFATEIPAPPAASFAASPRHELRASKQEVKAATKDDSVHLLDVRTPDEFSGATPYFESRGGHIPTAANIPFSDFLDPRGHLKPNHAIEELLAEAGVNRKQAMVVYCTGGVRSAFVAEVLRGIGIKAANYDASYWEWSADRSLPVTSADD